MTPRNDRLRLIGLLLSLLLVLLAGCGAGGSPAAPAAPQGQSGSALKVALILPSPIDDKGWSQAGYEGLQLIQKELGAEVAYSASIDEHQAEALFRQYAEQGFNFVIGHGGEYIKAAETVAQAFPRTKFAVSAGYAGNNKNLGALSFRDWETGYLTGALAALKSETRRITYIGGVDYPHMQEQAAAFERAAQATNAEVEASVRWIGGWTDTARAGQIAEEEIAKGSDVLVVDADICNVEVIRVAEAKGVYAIGWTLDQNHLAPKTVLTSALARVPTLLLRGATLVKEGRWEGKQYKFGLREGVSDLAPFHGLLTSAEEQQIMKVRSDILAGTISY